MAFWDKKKPQEDIAKQIVTEVTNALSQLQVSSNLDNNTLRARIASAISGGYDNADTLHNIYLDFGYPATLKFENFWNMYRRFGIAATVIDKPVDTCWEMPPSIEGDSALLREIELMADSFNLWQRLKGWDKRQRVGRYAGLFIRVRDGAKPSEPITQKLNGPASIIQIMPLYEGQLRVSETQQDPMADDFGLPTMYEYRGGGSTGDRNERDNNSFSIHPDRLLIMAEGSDNGDIYGIPALEPVYNSLMDLRKIIGAGGEGYYKNAAQSLVFKLMDATSAKDNAALLAKFNDEANDFMRNRARRSLWTPGMDTQTLQSTLANPKEFAMNAINDIAAGSGIPATILIGQQTGRLASQEDSRAFRSTCNSRNENHTDEMVRKFIDWCMKYGALKKAEYDVIWEDLLAQSDEEKLTNAEKMSTINQKQFQSGGDVPFSGEEIREAAGYDPEDMEEGTPGLDTEELEEDDEDQGEKPENGQQNEG